MSVPFVEFEGCSNASHLHRDDQMESGHVSPQFGPSDLLGRERQAPCSELAGESDRCNLILVGQSSSSSTGLGSALQVARKPFSSFLLHCHKVQREREREI